MLRAHTVFKYACAKTAIDLLHEKNQKHSLLFLYYRSTFNLLDKKKWLILFLRDFVIVRKKNLMIHDTAKKKGTSVNPSNEWASMPSHWEILAVLQTECGINIGMSTLCRHLKSHWVVQTESPVWRAEHGSPSLSTGAIESTPGALWIQIPTLERHPIWFGCLKNCTAPVAIMRSFLIIMTSFVFIPHLAKEAFSFSFFILMWNNVQK